MSSGQDQKFASKLFQVEIQNLNLRTSKTQTGLDSSVPIQISFHYAHWTYKSYDKTYMRKETPWPSNQIGGR